MEALTECLEALLITSHGNRTVEYASFDLSHVSKTKAIHVRDPVLVNLNISPFSFALKRLLRLLDVNLTGTGIHMTPLHPVPLVPGRVETKPFYIIFAHSTVNSELCAIGHPPQIISFS